MNGHPIEARHQPPHRPSDPRDDPVGRFGRGHAGKADKSGDPDRARPDHRKEVLPGGRRHHHLEVVL